MSGFVQVPFNLWREVSDFFAALYAPCKDCVRGNTHQCWQGHSCPTFQFRSISKRVADVKRGTLNLARWVVIESEILSVLRRAARPMRPSEIVLDTTRSKAVKSATISRLVRQGRIVETRTGRHSRLISLPQKRNPKDENANTTDNRGATRRPPARELGAGLADAGHGPGAI